jgi:hypothetical protein
MVTIPHFGSYTALSYVWGSPGKVKNIVVDGISLGVTANLFSALHDLRDDTRTLLLWVDAICINQSDNEEKAKQIGIVGQIYAGASHTIIYLGLGIIDTREPLCLAVLANDGQNEVEARVLESLAKKEWFSRVWVFQELVFSNDPWVQCGRSRVKWGVFYAALCFGDQTESTVSSMEAARIVHQSHRGLNAIKTVENHRDTNANGASPGNTMIELLHARRGLGVTDPRDMIFAHVGFAVDGTSEDIVVDYSKTWVQICTQFARYLLKQHGLSYILQHVSRDKTAPRFKDWPSWVPNWVHEGPKTYSDFVARHHAVFPTWVPHQGLVWPFKLSDRILSVSSPISSFSITAETIIEMQEILWPMNLERDSLGVLTTVPHTKEEFDDACFKVYHIWRNAVKDSNILPAEHIKLDYLVKYVVKVESEKLKTTFCAPVLLILALGYGHNGFIADRALARMASGKLAIVPESAQKGDLIVPLSTNTSWGLSEPYLFRAVESEHISESAQVDISNAVNMDMDGEDGPVIACEYVGGCFLDQTPSFQVSDTETFSKPFIMTLN